MDTISLNDDLELLSLRRATSMVRTAMTRIRWREAMQRRAIRVAAVVNMAPRLLSRRDVRRIKIDGRWAITVPEITEPILVLVVRTTGRTIDDLLEPLELEVHRAELVDLPRLAALELERVVKVVFKETAR
jgi:hypothetical protein